MKSFDYEIDGSGARVIVVARPLTAGCFSDQEVDDQISRLKRDLDAVARRMKRAIAEQRKQPPL